MIESKVRFPGAPLISDRGLVFPPDAVEDLRSFVTTPDAMGHREEKGGIQETATHSDPDGRGGGPLSKGGLRPTSDGRKIEELVNGMIPHDTAVKALEMYYRYILGGYVPEYAIQRACLYISEELGWRK